MYGDFERWNEFSFPSLDANVPVLKIQEIAKEKEKALKSLRLQRENIKAEVAKVQAEQGQ